MELFTSNFFIAGQLPGAVSISKSQPKWYRGRTFNLLAPEWVWVKNFKDGIWTSDQYREVYEAKLSKLDAQEVCDALGDGSVLLCWCSLQKYKCHRRMVSDFLLREINLVVPELSRQDFARLSLPLS
jgi:hypothetical protein